MKEELHFLSACPAAVPIQIISTLVAFFLILKNKHAINVLRHAKLFRAGLQIVKDYELKFPKVNSD